MASTLNPRTTVYEFFGPPGALFVTITVPLVTYALYFGCSEQAGGCPPALNTLPPDLFARLSTRDWWFSLWDAQATAIYFAWYAFCVAAWYVLPGDWIEGVQMRNGQTKRYKINAFPTFLLALGITAGIIIRYGPESFTFFYEKWIGFVTASLLMATLQAFYVHVMSYMGNKLLALAGNSGNHIYDFFIGRELNPSIGSFDIKSFNELRPGLILWVLIDISMACEQYTWYVIDALYNEPAVFTTMDITTDGFGFMLSAGDLFWVPFVYSLQARYLAFKHVELGPILTAVVIALEAAGFYIFRAANGEKNNFRNGHNPRNLKYLTTERGSKLLISGWWGLSRHPNYLGDLVMALAWSLATGFETPITYFYPVYFLVLLIHRQIRDDEQCHKKYGKDWDKYKKLVPYRIIPYIY